jgi:tight adherence protein B
MANETHWAIIFGIGVFMVVLLVGRLLTRDAGSKHTKRMISRLSEEQETHSREYDDDNTSILKAGPQAASRFLLGLPKGDAILELVTKAGMEKKVPAFLIFCGLLFFGLTLFLSKLLGAFLGLICAAALTVLLPRMYLKSRIKKRNEAFINMFPDAVDMIVRSVKSGHPLNTALRMIAENMDPPVKTEFKQLIDEIAFGRSTTEALGRLAQRVDEPDLQFFVVILSVQQETGGNLAEVLSNLSGIIRKRKQLRLKIRALTSEGRATAYILGSLPFVVFGAIHFTNPNYLLPLFNDPAGQMVLASALSLVAIAAFIVYNMLQIDI